MAGPPVHMSGLIPAEAGIPTLRVFSNEIFHINLVMVSLVLRSVSCSLKVGPAL